MTPVPDLPEPRIPLGERELLVVRDLFGYGHRVNPCPRLPNCSVAKLVFVAVAIDPRPRDGQTIPEGPFYIGWSILNTEDLPDVLPIPTTPNDPVKAIKPAEIMTGCCSGDNPQPRFFRTEERFWAHIDEIKPKFKKLLSGRDFVFVFHGNRSGFNALESLGFISMPVATIDMMSIVEAFLRTPYPQELEDPDCLRELGRLRFLLDPSSDLLAGHAACLTLEELFVMASVDSMLQQKRDFACLMVEDQ